MQAINAMVFPVLVVTANISILFICLNRKKSFLLTVLAFVAVTAFNLVIDAIAMQNGMTAPFQFLRSFLYFPIILLMMEGGVFQKLFVFLMSMTITPICLAVIEAISMLFTPLGDEMFGFAHLVISILILGTYTFLTYRYGRNIFDKMFSYGSNRDWALYVVSVAISFFILGAVQSLITLKPVIVFFVLFYIIWNFVILCFAIINTHEKAQRQMEQQHLQSELATAAKIQLSMLPNVFPAFPNRPEFDIYAHMNPAKEVGGDFYDFFMLDEHRLAVVMADVSGKGVPAALFMANAKTLLKNHALGGDLKSVIHKVNNLLCDGNDECMFVTVFMGILDIPSGKFTYVDAGHDVPLVKRGDKFEWLPANPGMMLAAIKDSEFVQEEIMLEKNDVLFLYTDGVTEAENAQKDIFTTERLITTINEYEYGDAKDLLTIMQRKIEEFTDGAEQSDDITMLALRIVE